MQNVHVYPTQSATAHAAARHIADFVKEKPTAVITYATGNTMLPVYSELARIATIERVDFSQTTAFHLDEYYPCEPTEAHSFVKYLHDYVFTPLKIPTDNLNLLNGVAIDPHSEAERYEKLLQEKPVDLAILGIGPGGHIGFNESGTPFDSMTQYAPLSTETIARDRQERGQNSPTHALTQGIGSILRSHQIILIAYGESKGEILHKAINEAITIDCPASALQTVTEKTSYFIDTAAASQI